MAEFALDKLDEYVAELPADLPPDPYHPDFDEYAQRDRRLRAVLVSQTHRMKPKAVSACKLAHKGMSYTEIAQQLKISPTTASKYVNSPDGKRLLGYLQHYASHRDGVSLQHRKGILYRIVVDNEKTRPNVAVQAIQEMNKMDGAYHEDKSGNVINIQINNEAFPRGALDIAHDTEVGK